MIAIASLLILAASAHAETYYRFELYGSASIPLNKDFEIGMPQSTVRIPGSFDFSPGPRGGLRVGVDGMGHWGQDIFYSYGFNDAKISVTGNGDFSFTPRVHQFGYNVLFYPASLRSQKNYWYVTAGAGGTFFTLSQETINQGAVEGLGKMKSHTSFAFNAGGGVRHQFNDRWGIRIDARDWMSHPPRFGLPQSSNDPAASVFPVKGIFHQMEISFAVVYCFKSHK